MKKIDTKAYMVKKAEKESRKSYPDRWASMWFWNRFIAIWILGFLGFISNSIVAGAMMASGWGLAILSFAIAVIVSALMEWIMGESVTKISWDVMTGNITKKGFLWSNGVSMFYLVLFFYLSLYLSLQWDTVFEYMSLSEKEKQEKQFDFAAIDQKYNDRLLTLRVEKEKDIAAIQNDIEHLRSLQDRGYVTKTKAELDLAQSRKQMAIASYSVREKKIEDEREAEKSMAMSERKSFLNNFGEQMEQGSAIVLGINVGIVGLRVLMLLAVGIASFYMAETTLRDGETGRVSSQHSVPEPAYVMVKNDRVAPSTLVSTSVLTQQEINEMARDIESRKGVIRKYKSRVSNADRIIQELSEELSYETDETKRKAIMRKIDTQKGYLERYPKMIMDAEEELRNLIQRTQ